MPRHSVELHTTLLSMALGQSGYLVNPQSKRLRKFQKTVVREHVWSALGRDDDLVVISNP